jgi:hypothetical protein
MFQSRDRESSLDTVLLGPSIEARPSSCLHMILSDRESTEQPVITERAVFLD